VLWPFEIPEELHFWATNNLLKHVASIISPWINMLAGRLKQGNCALLMTDSSTSASWLRKTHFQEKLGDNVHPIQIKVRIKPV